LLIARTEVLDANDDSDELSYMEIGYSPLAILLALLCGPGMVLGMVLNGFRELNLVRWQAIIVWRLQPLVSGPREMLVRR